MNGIGQNGDGQDGVSGDAPERTISDDDNKSQNATIQRIQSFRDNIAEYQLLFAQNELAAEVSDGQQHRAYHQLARGFLQLLRPYLTDDGIPVSQQYWEGANLGSFQIDPPSAITKPSQDEMQAALKAGHQQTIARANPRNNVEPVKYDVIGLRDFAAAPPEWQVSWDVMFGPEVSVGDLRSEIADPRTRVQPRSHRNEPITVVRTARIPREILDNAVTELENFVREIGMDIEMEANPYEGEGGPGL